jgi:hypothetical protein
MYSYWSAKKAPTAPHHAPTVAVAAMVSGTRYRTSLSSNHRRGPGTTGGTSRSANYWRDMVCVDCKDNLMGVDVDANRRALRPPRACSGAA